MAVESACQRIQEAVEAYNAITPELPLSISVGFAIRNGSHKNLKDVFKEADNHMYRKKLYRTQSVRSTIVNTLINTLKVRDLATEQHASRLEKLLVRMAALIGLPESTTADLSLLARFHDIGKVGISDAILLKEGPFTPEEWAEMKRHCEIGYRIALSAADLKPIADWILKHHEWWDGQGYPLGIKGGGQSCEYGARGLRQRPRRPVMVPVARLVPERLAYLEAAAKRRASFKCMSASQ